MNLALLLLISYLIGAIPTSVVIGKLAKGIDVRRHGSGNAGATNTWRVLGWKAGITVLALDVAKGALAARLVPLIQFETLPLSVPVVSILCGLLAVIGHVYPVYIGFRGGKGVATAAGMFVAIAPIPMGIAVGVFLLFFFIFGMVSVGSMMAAVSVPITIAVSNAFFDTGYHLLLLVISCVLVVFIMYNHRGNIDRIIHGREGTIRSVQLWRRILHR